ncbi:RNA-binding protein, putative [Bodo saltans]|uniref:RNA-binding protein, putative n=1 Tax=Bodo saltans TaxID=75058 RepID=A0A0S4J314_BODSA|nr:RNA-binding protein, putative [Bodo saltans]|eukprot:CUG31083.1 RNA-binding protein, putative [Bodo saltans]
MSESVFRGRGGESLVTKRVGKRGGDFESLLPLPGQEPGEAARSVEGWVLFVSGLPKETLEGDLMDIFVPQGIVRNIRMILDQRECKCIGHALVEMETAEECGRAVQSLNGRPLLSSPQITVDAAFLVEPEVAVKVKGEDEEDFSGAKKKGRDE